MLSQIRCLRSTEIHVDRKMAVEAHHSINHTKLRDASLFSATSPHSNNILSASFFLPSFNSKHNLPHSLTPKDRTTRLALPQPRCPLPQQTNKQINSSSFQRLFLLRLMDFARTRRPAVKQEEDAAIGCHYLPPNDAPQS